MLFIFVLYFLFLIGFSFGNQCPSSDYCTCSSDLTIIKCTNRRLTNGLLFSINSQLPESTVLLNLSSNSLTSIDFLTHLNYLQILDLSFNKIQYLPPDFLLKFPHLTSLYLQNNSLKTLPKSFQAISNMNIDLSNNPFQCTCQSKWFTTNNLLKNILCQNNKPFNENDFCQVKNFLEITPKQSEVVYENEPFKLNCSSNSRPYWTLNGKFYSPTMSSTLFSTIFIHRLQINHSGIWTCHNLNQNHSISLTVLGSLSDNYCQSIRMNTSKGYFYWPRTSINSRIEKKCPFGSAAWLRNSNEYARAWYTCSANGKWINFDVSQCAFQSNISRIFDRLSLTDTNLLLRLVKFLSKIDQNDLELFDIILLIDLIDEQQEKYKNEDRITLIYHLTDFILQVKHDFIYLYEYRMALIRLRLIIERLLDFTNQPWLYIGKELTAMTLQAPLSSTLCFVSNRTLLTIVCEVDNQYDQSRLVTIQFPFHLNKTNQNSIYHMIFYRQSTLFISDKMKNNNNPVVYMRAVSKSSLSPFKLTFHGQPDQASIGIWYENQSSWQIKSSVCKINEQNINLISTNCILFNNNSLAITYVNNNDYDKNLLFSTKYSQLTIYISSILASICFFLTILFYICFYKSNQMPRHFFHCLINYWLNLGILIPLFAFGIQLHEYLFLCEFIAITLHYLCLTTILWLTLLTYSIWRKLYVISSDKDDQGKSPVMIVDYDDISLPIMQVKSKPIIQFYLIAYGLALTICAVNVVISREQYIASKICFLNHFDSILILIIPILIFIFLSLVFLLVARNYIKQLSNKKIHIHDLSNDLAIHSENILLSKPKSILPILISSNHNNGQGPRKENYCHTYSNHNLHSSNKDHQYESLNQLLSILFQLILLTFLFLSSLAIYLHPLHSFKLRFEHIIYSNLYGFFVLFLGFYILSFYVLSRFNLIIKHYSQRENSDQLSKQFYLQPQSSSINSVLMKDYDNPTCTEQLSLLPSSQSYYLSNVDICELPKSSARTTLNEDLSFGSNRLSQVASEHYAFHRHIPKINATNSPQTILPFLSLDGTTRDINRCLSQRNSLYERMSRRSNNSLIESHSTPTRNNQLPSSPFPSSQSFTYPRISPSQAIIRPIPIARLSSMNTNKNPSNSAVIMHSDDHLNSSIQQNNTDTDDQATYHIISSPSTKYDHSAYLPLNIIDRLLQEESSIEKLINHKNSPYDNVRVGYIDEIEDGSVSLKSSITDSKSSLDTMSAEKDDSQTSSSSLDFLNDFHRGISQISPIGLYESTV